MAGAEPQTDILPAEHWAAQVGDAQDVPDIDTEDESTASLTSSIYKYRTISGRTYHAERGDAQYWASNDDAQGESLDINHHCCTLALGGKLHMAPLSKDIENVLDIGTGTGIWAIDFADQYPEATVTGTDITPVQAAFVPPNLKFEIEDCNTDWTFAPNHFDFVHLRWMIGSILDWYKLFARAYTHIKPGGWLETYEMSAVIESDDGTVLESSALGQWGKIFIEGGHKLGVSFEVVQDNLQRKAMEAAGFVDIQEKKIKMPIGSWPKDKEIKEQGLFSRAVLEQDPEGYILFITNTLGWSREQILVYVAQIRKEVRSGKYHPYYKQLVVWGRKPESV
ncbi:S-adenosyl-L-methionine-dependent methyltransferase [Lasiosphaeria hispida]|uniref:S-adenosyl-L-methionine-dependent methyltransferase n=1 Tax=Lasiosphaeria hispida TaxID=260671 RepID=A0AAJ0MF96_9PEZI|nr:S-adenosyl-L-methionine-dependent methyltransferase [Lasiosphaeria hispida]